MKVGIDDKEPKERSQTVTEIFLKFSKCKKRAELKEIKVKGEEIYDNDDKPGGKKGNRTRCGLKTV